VSRKLIRNAELRVRVNSLEDAGQAVAAALEQHKGYAAYATVYDNSRQYTLKVPAASYDSFSGAYGRGYLRRSGPCRFTFSVLAAFRKDRTSTEGVARGYGKKGYDLKKVSVPPFYYPSSFFTSLIRLRRLCGFCF
jgi:hypothetical protein